MLEPTDAAAREQGTRAECGSVDVLRGASKESWVESAGSVWLRSVRGQLAADWIALGLIQTLLNIVPRNNLWIHIPKPLNLLFGKSAVLRRSCSLTHRSGHLKGSLQMPIL